MQHDAAWLLDLGNQSLKIAASPEPGNVDHVERWQLPQIEDGHFAFARNFRRKLELMPGWPIYLSSTNPGFLPQLLREVPADTEVRLIDAKCWPIEVASEGTGSDRVLAAFAAWRSSGRAVFVADLGTAWTLDLVDPQGIFRGGAIGPGLQLQIRALRSGCPHLAAPADRPNSQPPTTTSAAVGDGIYAALAAALEGLVRRYALALRLSDFDRWLTGGDATDLQPWLEAQWRYRSHMVLHGLANLPQRTLHNC